MGTDQIYEQGSYTGGDDVPDPYGDVSELLSRGRKSGRKRTQNITRRIETDLATLRTYVDGEDRVATLEAELAAARRDLNMARADDPAETDA